MAQKNGEFGVSITWRLMHNPSPKSVSSAIHSRVAGIKKYDTHKNIIDIQ